MIVVCFEVSCPSQQFFSHVQPLIQLVYFVVDDWKFINPTSSHGYKEMEPKD